MRLIRESELLNYVSERQANRSDRAFAEELGLHPNTIFNLRKGITKTFPVKLMRALGIRIAYEVPK